MNEVQRQAYLKVMGIQTYFPKTVLIGAKPSPAYDLPPEVPAKSELAGEPAPEASAVARPRRRTTGASTGGIRKKLAQELAGAGARKAEKPAAATGSSRAEQPESAVVTSVDGGSAEPALVSVGGESTNTEQDDELRFKLRYFRINGQLAIIDEVPHQKSERLNQEDRALLLAILRALQLDCSDVELNPESFSWPLAENLSMKNDPSTEARRALSGFIRMRQEKDRFSNLLIKSGFIRMRQEKDRFSNLLIFAGQADKLLVQQKDGVEIRDFAAGSSDYFITVTNSLHSMLAYPALKREVWQQLQSLRKRLAESS